MQLADGDVWVAPAVLAIECIEIVLLHDVPHQEADLVDQRARFQHLAALFVIAPHSESVSFIVGQMSNANRDGGRRKPEKEAKRLIVTHSGFGRTAQGLRTSPEIGFLSGISCT